MAKVTMLFGLVGAGKTTVARQLAIEGAVCLSLDEWTIAASGDQFHVDPQQVSRMLDQLVSFWPQLALAGVDVVLDLAFWDRSARDQVRKDADLVGAEVELIWVQCDEAERRRRSVARSSQSSYILDGDGFDWIEANRSVDPLGNDEPHVVLVTTTREL